jgi:glycine/D-amino acid oxidase-like deaminating enzyme
VQRERKELTIVNSVDVVVIGGGSIGASVAYYLSREKIRVRLFERRELGSEASSANFGGIPVQTTECPELTLASIQIFRNLASELEYDFELEHTGSYLLMDNEDQRSMLEANAKRLAHYGIKVDMLSGKEVREIDPDISLDVLGGSRCFDGVIVNPMKVVYAFASAARRLGAQIDTYSEVQKIRTENGKVKSVITSKGETETRSVVIATGAWSPVLAGMLNLRIPVLPRRGQILLTEAFKLGKIRYLIDADYLVTGFNLEAVKKSHDPRIKLGVSSVLTQPSNGNWLVGTSRDFPGYDKRTTLETLTQVARRAIRFLPKLKHANIIRAMSGLRPFCEDGLPIISAVDSGGLVIATGHHGEGIALSPITGKLVAELIAKGHTSMPIDEYSYIRFKVNGSG